MAPASDFSPAAQAVLDGVADRYSGLATMSTAVAAAAALRAAVEQCAYKREIHPDSLIAEMIIEADDLLAIAAELETSIAETDDY